MTHALVLVHDPDLLIPPHKWTHFTRLRVCVVIRGALFTNCSVIPVVSQRFRQQARIHSIGSCLRKRTFFWGDSVTLRLLELTPSRPQMSDGSAANKQMPSCCPQKSTMLLAAIRQIDLSLRLASDTLCGATSVIPSCQLSRACC